MRGWSGARCRILRRALVPLQFWRWLLAAVTCCGRFDYYNRRLGNRWRGLTMLTRTRWFRTTEMWRAVHGPSQAEGWNR